MALMTLWAPQAIAGPLRALQAVRPDCVFMDDFSAERDLRVAWSGECADGFAQGQGTAIVFDANKSVWLFRFEGTLRDGMMQGTGYVAWPGGLFAVAPFENGKMNGLGQIAMKGSWGIRLKTEGMIKDNHFPEVDEENGPEMGSAAYISWVENDVAALRRDGKTIETREDGAEMCRGHLEELTLLMQQDFVHPGWKASEFKWALWDYDECVYSRERIAMGLRRAEVTRDNRDEIEARADAAAAQEIGAFRKKWAAFVTSDLRKSLNSFNK